ncbi:hypothetical protein RclHR1_02830011 [Rhizophagus clarus]|uniref:Protein kinase domain-containing protein n=1 Tax=Rhizophagus clarus TaxID=94130 RepID=A0A2Z6R424_9GLOM|nr:hypothetical protein RclHR1_02830011 [Rhizophagus clarus]
MSSFNAAVIRKDLVNEVHNAFLDYYYFHDNIHKQCNFMKQTVLADGSLTEDEKAESIKLFTKYYDREKVLLNEGTRRICENCNKKCLATLYCERCVRDYLNRKFSNWSSGNNDIDNLIQKCQKKSLGPNEIVEWIPYYNLENINYTTKGGFSEIYTADWVGGHFNEWDSKEQQLKRIGTHKVILKKLENIGSANRSCHLILSNKYDFIVRCFGLTVSPLDGKCMLVMEQLDTNLRKYLQQNYSQLTWKEKVKITLNIIIALNNIHKENLIHRDLHSGNILHHKYTNSWFIGDFGFCGPADKKLNSIYGNLPYIAPEIINGSETTFKSDIYSFAMLMWEISAGQPPFINLEKNNNLAANIIAGMRPRIITGTPSQYEELINQCWDDVPLKRPNSDLLKKRIIMLYQNMPNEINNNLGIFSSNFLNKTQPEGEGTEEPEKEFLSKSYDFNIPENIDDFVDSNNKINNKPSSIIIKGNEKSVLLNDYIQREIQEAIQETIRQQEEKYYIVQKRIMKYHQFFIIDKYDVQNNSNLHASYDSNAYNFSIPDNIKDFDNSSNENNNNILESSNILKDEIYNNPNSYSKMQDVSHNINDNNSDIYWGRSVKEHLAGSTKWNIYVITRGLYYPFTKMEVIADDQVINFISEEARFVIPNDPLPNSIKIPEDLREIFDEALDNELGLSFREAHYNLVGIGTGYKQTGGKFTELPAIIFYVRQKGILRRGCGGIFPEKICGFLTDVIEACVATPCAGLGKDTCRSYQKNVMLGSSIGVGSKESRNTTGTLSAVACENKSPNQIGIISCEHVLKFKESNHVKKITIYQPSNNDHLFELRRELRGLLDLSKTLEENGFINKINQKREELKIAESQNSKLATYVKGMRKNFVSKINNNKKYGVDAGFCVFDNESRKLYAKNFPIPPSYLKNAGLSTSLEGTYTYNELKFFNYNNRVFKVGRTTGLTIGQLLPTDLAIACNLTNESIKDSRKLEMEKHIPSYDNAEQKIFIGYMKSQLDSEICQERKKCYPTEWFDRQLAFKFEPGDFDSGDSGASIMDGTGKALGILHAKWTTPYQVHGIASPYFAILEALDVSIHLFSNPVTPTVIPSFSNIQNNYDRKDNLKMQDVKQPSNSQKNQSKTYLDQYCSYYYKFTL